MTIDLLPTIAQLIGAKLPEHKIDGKNIWTLMKNSKSAKSPQEAYYFYYGNQLQAVRSGKWKALYQHQQDLAYWQLFDVEKDPGEEQDLASAHPEVLTRLKDLARQARVPPAPR